MPYRPNIKNADGTLTDLPLEAETAVRLKTSRSIGLSGVTATSQSFNGSSAITIPVTAVPATLLTGTASINTTGNAATANTAKDYNASDGTIKSKFSEVDGNLGKIKIGTTYYSVRSTTTTSDTGQTGFITFII